jgi:hypothetical protein
MPRLRRARRRASAPRRSPRPRARAAGGRVTATKRRQPRPTVPSARRGRRVRSRRRTHSARGSVDPFSPVGTAVGPPRRARPPLPALPTRTPPASPQPRTEPVRPLSP